MTISEWINIGCAFASLVAAIIIAVLQCKQASRMEKFEKRQDDRDEKRHLEEVKAKAVSFISKYYTDREFIPLCAIAAMYNELYFYSREMFREFCCCTKEVQNKILEYSQVDLRVDKSEIYDMCYDALKAVIKRDFKNDKDVFNDRGKYIKYGLVRYGNESIPSKDFDYINIITDELSHVYRENIYDGNPILTLQKQYNFGSCDEIYACQFAMVVAEYIAIYKGNSIGKYKDYISPSDDDLDTMEDLFLNTLFEIYTNLVI